MVKNKHCCKLMEYFIKKTKKIGYRTNVEVYYSAVLREYYIGSQNRQSIFYCPWCGYKLPVSLRNEYCYILKQEYEIDINIYKTKRSGSVDVKNDFELEKNLKIPMEFKSDSWWKKRGL